MQREAERHVRGRGGKHRAGRAGQARREGGVPLGLTGGAGRGSPSSALMLRPLRLRLQVSIFYRTSPKHKLKIIKVSRVPLLGPRGTARGGGVAALLTGGPAGAPGRLPRPLGRGELGRPRAASTKGREWEPGGAKGGTQRPASVRWVLLGVFLYLTPGLSFLICKLGRM